MANLLDLANKVKQFISAGPQNILNGARQVANLQSNVARQVNDNQGWYRQGQFTPLQQISDISRQVNTPQLQQQFQAQPTKNLSDFATQYVGNRYVAPITQIPYNLGETKQAGLDFIKKPSLDSAFRWGGGALGLLGGAASVIPDPVQDVGMPLYDYYKGVVAAQKGGQNTIDSYKTGLSSLSGQKITGLGDAFGNTPTQKNIGNLAEFPIILGTLHNMNKSKINAEQFKAAETDILRALHGIKNYDSWKVPTQMEVLGEVTRLAKKLAPDIVKSPEMKLMETRQPVKWANIVSTFLQDRLMKAKSPEINFGFNVNKMKKVPEENLIPFKKEGAMPQAQGVIPEGKGITADSQVLKEYESYKNSDYFKNKDNLISTLNQLEGNKETPTYKALDQIRKDRGYGEAWVELPGVSKSIDLEKSQKLAQTQIEKTNLNGFTDQMSPMQKAKVEKTLDSSIMYNGNVYKKREFVSKLIEDGFSPDPTKNQLVNSKGRFYEVSKTEADYARHLSSPSIPSVEGVKTPTQPNPNLLPWETPEYLKANPRPEFMNGSPKPPKGVEDFTREEVKNNANFALAKSDAEAKGGPFDKIFAQWIGKRESSKTKATVTASEFVKAPGDPMSIIKAIESPGAKVNSEQAGYIKKLRGVYDKLFADAKAAGVDMNYLKDYITHIWDRPVNEVMGLYKDAKQKFQFSGERLVPTYEEGIKMGLTPKFSHPALILEDYVKKLEETKSNLELFTNLKKEKIVVPGSTVRNNPNFLPINAPGFPAAKARIDSAQTYVGNWYAPADIARKINQVFTPQDYGTAGKVVGGMAKISGKIQDLTMSGGVPGTPLNAWSFAQIQKEVLAGRITSPIKAILKSLPGAGATDLFKAEAPTIIRMQENNLPINTTFNIAGLVDPKYIKQTLGEKVGKVWNQLANEATFKKFSPQLMINMFKDVEKSVLDSGKSAQEASQIAANSVRQFYGLPGTDKAALANSFVEDLKGAVFFAPHYRQSMINFWVNNLKSLANPLAKENQNNAKFMVGALLTYLAMNKINKDNTGNNMWENTTGNEDKMLIKTQDGYVKIPFLSSIATVPRTGFKIAKDVVQGDLPQALSEGKNLLSSLIRPPLDVMTNKDYFGRDITDPNSPSWADRGLYLAGQYNHPYAKAALNTFGENLPKDVKTKLNISSTPKPAYQTVTEALELPIRFMNNKPGQDALSTARYFDDREQITKSLDKGSLDLWNVLHPQKTEGRVLDNTTISSVQRATILLNNPQVRAAEELLAGQQKTRGEQVDPIWNLTPQQRQMVWASQVQLPGQKNTYDTYLGKQSWYKPFQQERSAFFDSLPKSTSSAPVDSSKMAYPQPSPEVQAQMDAKNWKDPGVQAWFAARDQYNNQQLLALGLPPIESNGFGSGSSGAKKPKKITIAKASIKKLPAFKLTSSGKRKLAFKLAKPPSTKMAKGSSTKMKSYKVAKATKAKPSKLAAFKIARKGSILA